MRRYIEISDVTKDSVYRRAFLRRVADDEPIFILRGRDALAGAAIAEWVLLAKAQNVNPAKIAAAEAHLDCFDEYASKHKTRLPD